MRATIPNGGPVYRRDDGRGHNRSGKPEKSLEPVFLTRWIAKSKSKRWVGMQGTAWEARKLRPKHGGAPLYSRSSRQAQAGPLQPPSEEKEHPSIESPRS